MDVDALLAQLRQLLGRGQPPMLPARQFGSAAPPVPGWTGALSESAHAASASLEERRGLLADVYGETSTLTARSGAVAASARSRVDAIIERWREDRRHFASVTHLAAGQAALLAAGQRRVDEAAQVVRDAQAAFEALAGQLDVAAARLPDAEPPDAREGDDGSIRLVDYTTDPDDPYYDDPPEPGGGYGSYHYGYQFQTGEGWSDEQLMGEVQQNINTYFTFTGDQQRIVEGADINLDGPFGAEPVRVTDVEPTSFSLVSLPGHSEGAGRVIKFSIVPAEASPVAGRLNWELRVAASGPLSMGSLVPGASWGNKAIWGVFADNLDTRLPALPPQPGRGAF